MRDTATEENRFVSELLERGCEMLSKLVEVFGAAVREGALRVRPDAFVGI